MSPFSLILKVAILCAIGVMALSPQDAIHVDDLERYEEFMNAVSGSQFLDMYMENAAVKIDIYEYPSNDRVQSAHFKPSSKADQYFQQEKEQADALEATENEGLTERAAICRRDEHTEVFERLSTLEKRRSRCYQFCGTVHHCTRGTGCPHCYAVRMGCLWQKWCR
ncbi:uncharacterized protein FTOL_01654 [Fusarium torulosum]|uniref:Uncharacterized protein n=1 Tax=Fusarium torulosum TaxID=33205 RepID=A0AAE8SDX8_9HYPO|nr:uncharacterized protein FTOL_01654 [Fusarium torulosum]